MILCFHWRICSWRDLKTLVHCSELNYWYTPNKWLSALLRNPFFIAKYQTSRGTAVWNYYSPFLSWNNSKAVVINTLREVVTCKRAWTRSRWFQAPFFLCASGCHSSHTTQRFPALLCCSRALQLRRGHTYYADLSQTAPRLLRPFLGRWNTKEGIQLGTPPMSLACCTPRNVAEQRMPGS